tara:strand:+ start:5766 stop:6209 length:444 start_codon:yes stop_codon:yes gene_type:complete
MVNLKRSLESILNSKNYKFIIYLLMGLIFVFLICGNYNLVEGLTKKDMSNHLNKITADTGVALNSQKKIHELYQKYNAEKKDKLDHELEGMTKPKNVVESFLEGMHHCSPSFSNLGLKGNQANVSVNSQCESLARLKKQNKSLLNGS